MSFAPPLNNVDSNGKELSHGFTAILKEAYIEHLPDESQRLVGKIYEDRTNRFNDGDTVYTSRILNRHNDVFKTRNSVYLVQLLDVNAIPAPVFKAPINTPAITVPMDEDSEPGIFTGAEL
jgi:hypothetical protein